MKRLILFIFLLAPQHQFDYVDLKCAWWNARPYEATWHDILRLWYESYLMGIFW